VFEFLREDIQAVFERDPAVRSVIEVVLCYPGFHAMLFYRLSHALWERHFFLLGRFVSHLGRFFTGIEIHPGARIGRGFFIDHGMGVVVGETAEIGDNCTLYHGVTLGGTSWPFKVGDNSKIGSNSVVVKEVPDNSTVVGIPGKVVISEGKKAEPKADLEHGQLPDPQAKAIACLFEQIQALEKKVSEQTEELDRLRGELGVNRKAENA